MSDCKKHDKENIAEERYLQLLNEYSNSVFFGGSWSFTSNSGSRYAYWGDAPSISIGDISARGVCDHFIYQGRRRKS